MFHKQRHEFQASNHRLGSALQRALLHPTHGAPGSLEEGPGPRSSERVPSRLLVRVTGALKQAQPHPTSVKSEPGHQYLFKAIQVITHVVNTENC